MSPFPHCQNQFHIGFFYTSKFLNEMCDSGTSMEAASRNMHGSTGVDLVLLAPKRKTLSRSLLIFLPRMGFGRFRLCIENAELLCRTSTLRVVKYRYSRI